MWHEKRFLRSPMMLMLILCLLASGCGGGVRVVDNNRSSRIDPPAQVPDEETLPPKTEGSLWVSNQSRSLFFTDTKARHRGDIVTVRVIENAKGTKDAKTKTGRTSSLSASTASFFGLPTNTLNNLKAGTNFSNAFDGNGSTSRSGSLTAEVTAMVTRVFQNGNMRIEGRREVLINKEKEYLFVSGIIRPEDVNAGNVVLSTVIADAKIEYSGHGVINDKQRPGWLTRAIDFVWPF